MPTSAPLSLFLGSMWASTPYKINHTNYNLLFFLTFIYIILEPMNIINDKTCDTLKFPIIKLSILSPSIIILANEYIIKYINVSCPLNFLLFCINMSNINIENVTNDSYKNVGWTSMYFPYSYIPILHRRFVSSP